MEVSAFYDDACDMGEDIQAETKAVIHSHTGQSATKKPIHRTSKSQPLTINHQAPVFPHII